MPWGLQVKDSNRLRTTYEIDNGQTRRMVLVDGCLYSAERLDDSLAGFIREHPCLSVEK